MPYGDADQQRAYQRAWLARRRKAWFAGRSCERCGALSDLQLHHRDPAQKLDHHVWSWATGRREAELAKCVVLCEGCHKGQHAREAPRDAAGRFLRAAFR